MEPKTVTNFPTFTVRAHGCDVTFTSAFETLAAGYGPVCAEKFGLAWGDTDGLERQP